MRQALTFTPEDAMLAEIFLLRLETELRATQKAAKVVHVQPVPVALVASLSRTGLTDKHSAQPDNCSQQA
jgi:hypothetical protein